MDIIHKAKKTRTMKNTTRRTTAASAASAANVAASPSPSSCYITTIHENDILLGRGGKNNQHIGNEKLRILARRQCERYRHASKKEKSMLSRQLVTMIRSMNPPGRFLKKEGDCYWQDVHNDVAREKVAQVLRDAMAAVTPISSSSSSSPTTRTTTTRTTTTTRLKEEEENASMPVQQPQQPCNDDHHDNDDDDDSWFSSMPPSPETTPGPIPVTPDNEVWDFDLWDNLDLEQQQQQQQKRR